MNKVHLLRILKNLDFSDVCLKATAKYLVIFLTSDSLAKSPNGVLIIDALNYLFSTNSSIAYKLKIYYLVLETNRILAKLIPADKPVEVNLQDESTGSIPTDCVYSKFRDLLYCFVNSNFNTTFSTVASSSDEYTKLFKKNYSELRVVLLKKKIIT